MELTGEDSIPGGGVPTAVRDVSGSCANASGAGNLAWANDGALVVHRGNCVSAFYPDSPNAPLWKLGVSGGRTLAFGSAKDGPFIAVGGFPFAALIGRLPKPSLILTQDGGTALPGKHLIDFATAESDCLAGSTITLQVKFSPSDLVPATNPKQVAVWTVEDPDDPSDDPQIDPDGASADDNIIRSLVIWPYEQWTEVSGFHMNGDTSSASVTSEIGVDSDGTSMVSKVRFHPSCLPGDNYRFKVSLSVPVYGTLESYSQVVTIWRRFHIERDSMGLATSFNQCNQEANGIECDAAMGDVPDPVLTYLTEAFRPAYIDVALPTDTGADTPNVAFQYNVPDTPGQTEIKAQGNAGRGRSSSAGRWICYVQGAYEGDKNSDNDPNSENGDGAVTPLGTVPTLVYFETVRDSAQEVGRDTEYDNNVITAHEFGHQFGISHVQSTCGLMSSSLPIQIPLFCPEDIRRVRSDLTPAAP